MAFPAHPDKHAGRPYLTAQGLLATVPCSAPPARVVLCWQRTLFDRLCAASGTAPAPLGALLGLAGTPGALVRITPSLGAALLPVGAPTVAIVLEELAAGGVDAVIGVGLAGALAPDLGPGDLVVCSEAVRDEGTSHHYLPSSETVLPDSELSSRLRAELDGAPSGPSWTTDAPYRETLEEIERFRAAGVLTVDMEASALFAVAAVTGVRAAVAFCVSDLLAGERWTPAFGARAVADGMFELFEAASRTLVGLDRPI